jgi:predicted phage tail protein
VSENKKIVSANIGDNSFELILRILGNEFIAIKIGSTNFSGKLIAGGVLLLFFTFIIMEMFGINQMIGLPVVE